MALAGDSPDPGKICVAPGIPYTDDQLSQILNVTPQLLTSAKQKLIQTDRIFYNNNVINIVNWEHYQGEYQRLRDWRAKRGQEHLPEATHPSQQELTPVSHETLNETTNETPTQVVTKETKNEQKNESFITEEEGRKRGGVPSTLLLNNKVEGFKDLKNLLIKLETRQEKVAALGDIFAFCHPDAPQQDREDNLHGRIAGILKNISYDYQYLLKAIWDTSSVEIAGSHLNYIQGVITGRRAKRGVSGGEKRNPDKFIRGRFGHMVKR